MTFDVCIIEDAAAYYHCQDCVIEKHLTAFEIGVTHDGRTLIVACLVHQKEVARFALKEVAPVVCMDCGEGAHGPH